MKTKQVSLEEFLVPLKEKNNSMEPPMWKEHELEIDYLHQVYGNNTSQCYLVEDEGNLIGGYILLEHDYSYWSQEENKQDSYYIHKLFILKQYNGKGYSKKIFSMIEDKAKKEHKQYVRLDCRAYITGINQLYESLGYPIYRKMVSQYSGNSNLRQKEIL